MGKAARHIPRLPQRAGQGRTGIRGYALQKRGGRARHRLPIRQLPVRGLQHDAASGTADVPETESTGQSFILLGFRPLLPRS